jgi:hypothetical protein
MLKGCFELVSTCSTDLRAVAETDIYVLMGLSFVSFEFRSTGVVNLAMFLIFGI